MAVDTDLNAASLAVARAVNSGDPERIAAARANMAALRIAKTIERETAGVSIPLKRRRELARLLTGGES
jgi:hypothetical protein